MSKPLKERLTAMSDEALLTIIENKPDDYTADTLAIVEKEIAARGGLEVLKQNVQHSIFEPTESHHREVNPHEPPSQSNELVTRLKKFYLLLVLAAYVLFSLVIHWSLWFYWLCVFAMIAFYIRVLINARRLTPDEEYEEIAREKARHPDAPTSAKTSSDNQAT